MSRFPLFASTLLAPLLLSAPAHAADDDLASGGVSVLVGPGYWAEDGPARLRISARGEAAIATDDAVGLSIVLPVDIASSGSDGFGWSVDRTLIEVVPSARMVIAPASVVRGYADLGAGPWFQITRTDTVFGDVESQRSGLMTTAALGLVAGKTEAESIKFIVEPVRMRTYFVDGDDRIRAEYGGMLGLGVAF